MSRRKRPALDDGHNNPSPGSMVVDISAFDLCPNCDERAIPELEKAFAPQILPRNFTKTDFKIGNILDIIESEARCSLCRFFVDTLQLRTRDNSYRVEGEGKHGDIRLIRDPEPWFHQAGISIDMKPCPFVWLHIGPEAEEPLICVTLEPMIHNSDQPVPMPDRVYPIQRNPIEAYNGSCNPGVLKSWLDKCTSRHAECNTTYVALPEQFMVIDVINETLERLPRDEPFLTLSYVWGKGAEQQRYWLNSSEIDSRIHVQHRAGLELPKPLPQTIHDAIQITKKLEQRYLWVDLFCIDQTNEMGKQEQIEAMDVIFASSWLTLVCVDGPDANSGLTGASRYMSQTRQPSVLTRIGRLRATHVPSQWVHNGDSAWDQRAWTLQERLLSRRCLFFSDTYISMLCQEELFHELITVNIDEPKVVPKLHDTYFREDGSGIDLDIEQWSFDTYGNLVSVFMGRNITDANDIHNACRGSLKRMSLRCGVKFHFGLPKHDFLQSLLWVPHHKAMLSRRPGFPSWSWLGWQGRSEYPYWIHNWNTKARPHEPDIYELRRMILVNENFREKNCSLEAEYIDNRTMTAPVVQLKTATRMCKTHLLHRSGELFQPSLVREQEAAIGDQWALIKTDGSKLKNHIGEYQDFERSLVSFRVSEAESREISRQGDQVCLIFIKYWMYIWDSKGRKRDIVSALVTVKDKEGSYHRLACVTLPGDEWLAGERRDKIVTLV